MKSPRRVLIVGGGPVGLALAARLACGPYRQQLDVRVLDGRDPPVWSRERTDLRVYALSRLSQQLLDSVGAWDAVAAARISPYRSMLVWEGSLDDGVGVLRFDAAEIGEPDLGHIVEDSLLRVSLLDVLRTRTEATLTFGRSVESLEFGADDVSLKLDDGERIRADLIVAADGSASRLRALAQLPVITEGYGQQALVAHIGCELDHGQCARQRFLPGGPLAFLPLADGRASIVWSMPVAQAESLLAADEAVFLGALQQASGGVLGRLSAPSPRAAFPLRALHVLRYSAPRLVLVGDAAHTVHPLAGQGMNLGLLDAAQLAGVLEQALEEGQSPGDLRVLRRYERASKGENLAMLLALDVIARSRNLPGWVSPARRFGLSAVQRFGSGRRWLMRQALGIGSRRAALFRPRL